MAYEGAEEGLFRALNGAGSNPALDAAALLLDVSALAYIIVLWAVQLWWVRRRALAFDLVVALALSIVVVEALKFAIGRWRPIDVYPGVHVLAPLFPSEISDPAFPSGHTARAFVFAVLLGLHERRWLPALVPYAVLVGLARVYEGAHYPSDILGGAVAGIAFGVLLWKLDTLPAYVRLREKLIGRWLSPGPGARGGSTSPPDRGPS